MPCRASSPPRIGIALGFDVRGGATLASLRTRLREAAALGFTNVELASKATAVILELRPHFAENAAEALATTRDNLERCERPARTS